MAIVRVLRHQQLGRVGRFVEPAGLTKRLRQARAGRRRVRQRDGAFEVLDRLVVIFRVVVAQPEV